MPIRNLIAHIQQHKAEMNEINGNSGRQLTAGGSQSAAQSGAVTNAINVAGIPIVNSVSGTHTGSTSTGHTGSLKEQFSIGHLGLTAGLNSEQIGTGFGVDRKPGEFAVHLGGLNFGLTNHANDVKNTQTQTVASSSATGAGATSISKTNAHSNNYALGGIVSGQNTISGSKAHSSSLTGTTSANAAATSTATQNSRTPNPTQFEQYQQQPSNSQPDVAQPQQSAQQPFVEMKVVVPQPGYQQNPQPVLQQGGFPQPGSQTNYQQPNYPQRPGYQPTGIDYIISN